MSDKKEENKLSFAEAFKQDNPSLWKKAVELFKKDKKGTVDEKDPEYDAQKIYYHWLEAYR